MQDINIAVVGGRGAGKSAFIRRALDMANAPPKAVCMRTMTVDGCAHTVRLLEMTFADMRIGAERTSIQWPDAVEDTANPRIDGAIAVYDVMNRESFAPIPKTLGTSLSRTTGTRVFTKRRCAQRPSSRLRCHSPWPRPNVTSPRPSARSTLPSWSRKQGRISVMSALFRRLRHRRTPKSGVYPTSCARC